MSIALVTGPANAGKAHVLLEAVRGHVARGREPLLVVPTEADQVRYRRELAEEGLALGVRVERFEGLLAEVLARVGGARAPLGEMAREHLLARLASARPGMARELATLVAALETQRVTPARLRGALRVSRSERKESGERVPGEQIHGEGVSGEQVPREGVPGEGVPGEGVPGEGIPGEGLPGEGVSGEGIPGRQESGEQAPLERLCTVFERYQQTLAQMRRADRELRATRALDGLRRKPASWGAVPVLLYGFDDFTELQVDTILTLGGVVGAPVMVSLAYEPGRVAFLGRAATFQRLAPLADAHTELPARADHYAASSREALHHLERSLLSDDPQRVEAGEAVRLLEGGSPRAELELVAGEVRALLDGGVPAEEIAIVHRSPESIAGLLGEVLEDFEIPHTQRRQTLFADTALGRGLLGMLRCATEVGELGDLLAWLGAPGVLEHPELLDRFELSARRRGALDGARARALWEAENWPLERIDRVREAAATGASTLLNVLGEELQRLASAASASASTGASNTNASTSAATASAPSAANANANTNASAANACAPSAANANANTNASAANANANTNASAANACAPSAANANTGVAGASAPSAGAAVPPDGDQPDEVRVLAGARAALEELRELARAAPELAPSAGELVGLLERLELESGEHLELEAREHLEPGRVVVLDPLSLRARRVRMVFACGLQEGVFPTTATPNPLLQEHQRRELARGSGLVLRGEPDTLAAERYLLYALTSRPLERLTLSWHSADEEGTPVARSLFVDDVCDLFTAALSERTVRRVAGAADWPGPGRPAGAIARRAAAISADAVAPSAPAGPIAPLRDERVLAEMRERVLWSASALESWTACPVKWFVERLLRATDIEPDPEPLARGGLAHAALKDTLERLRERSGSARLTPASVGLAKRLLAEALLELEPSYPLSVAPARLPGARRRLRVDLERYLEYAAEQSSPLEPTYLELEFGFGEHPRERPGAEADSRTGEEDESAVGATRATRTLPALELGEGVLLRGRIDRVDVGSAGEALVYDYKGLGAPPAAKWLADGSFQVALYMRAVETLLDHRALGGFYQPLAGADIRARGVLDGDSTLDIDCVRTDRLDHDAMRELLDECMAAALRAAGEARAGALEPRPATCAYNGGCSYPTICRCER